MLQSSSGPYFPEDTTASTTLLVTRKGRQGRVRWRTPVTAALGRQRQKDQKFQVILSKYETNSGYMRLTLEKEKAVGEVAVVGVKSWAID